ncbi:MAG TPA: metallophosphoesterase, partial [Ferruginibacter sp.]|nr:metallophosphoesterase [Ferruginibacter sp.]
MIKIHGDFIDYPPSPPTYNHMNRKKFLQQSVLAGAGIALAPNTSESFSNYKEALKIVFFSDVHVKPDPVAENGMLKAIRNINSIHPAPDFIINGGDAIMDALGATKPETQAQWDVWNRIINENKLPIYHCIGNHDVWGWQLKDESVKADPMYDKNWVLQQHRMASRYYSFRKGKWHFIVLDGTQYNNGGYIARIDEEQFGWLENELNNIPPGIFICIVSHIPIISFCSAMFIQKNEPNGDWKILRVLLHTDARRIKDLFKKYKNIKTCLSGHIHLQDEVEY